MASADHSPYQFAAERYVLGELSDEEKLDFEDHYFSCGSCAQDVEDLTSIRMTSPAVLRELERSSPKWQPLGWLLGSWRGGWAPSLALGALALVASVTAYQNVFEIPSLKAETDHLARLTEEPTPLRAKRGDGVKQEIKGLPRIHVFVIKNEWQESYALYKARVTRDDSSRILFEEEGTVGEGKNLRVEIPARKLGPGNFKLVIFGGSGTEQLTDVANLNFEILGD